MYCTQIIPAKGQPSNGVSHSACSLITHIILYRLHSSMAATVQVLACIRNLRRNWIFPWFASLMCFRVVDVYFTKYYYQTAAASASITNF